MPRKKLKLTLALLFVLCITGLQAQQAITPSGSWITAGGSSISYSIGQIFYTPVFGSGGSMVPWVQGFGKLIVF